MSPNRTFSNRLSHNQTVLRVPRSISLLEEAQYEVVWNNQTGHDLFFVDRQSHGTNV